MKVVATKRKAKDRPAKATRTSSGTSPAKKVPAAKALPKKAVAVKKAPVKSVKSSVKSVKSSAKRVGNKRGGRKRGAGIKIVVYMVSVCIEFF
ncbi:hypothetical protein RIF29_33914 [Crotalaria pallida]|uniref:Uncharacterized protein n=1 Tax=Crotalaria pallida TaxID=3830 RepID=A0AAN9HT30_CROPI